jgi:hypothetical protein
MNFALLVIFIICFPIEIIPSGVLIYTNVEAQLKSKGSLRHDYRWGSSPAQETIHDSADATKQKDSDAADICHFLPVWRMSPALFVVRGMEIVAGSAYTSSTVMRVTPYAERTAQFGC